MFHFQFEAITCSAVIQSYVFWWTYICIFVGYVPFRYTEFQGSALRVHSVLVDTVIYFLVEVVPLLQEIYERANCFTSLTMLGILFCSVDGRAASHDDLICIFLMASELKHIQIIIHIVIIWKIIIWSVYIIIFF